LVQHVDDGDHVAATLDVPLHYSQERLQPWAGRWVLMDLWQTEQQVKLSGVALKGVRASKLIER
jgi:hypothetical protein